MNASTVAFDADRHNWFTRVSRDLNPVHVDALTARRTQAGAPIVHGMHSLLRLLEVAVENGVIRLGVTRLKAQFRKPIYVGEEVTVERTKEGSGGIRVRMMANGLEVLLASIGYGPETAAVSLLHALTVPETIVPSSARELELEQIVAQSGRISFASTLEQVETMFPVATRLLTAQRVAALMCCSCLVGMVVPGLHSLFSAVDLCLTNDVSGSAHELCFEVSSVEPRFRLARIAVLGGGLHGALETVSRLPPVRQAPVEHLTSMVKKNEFCRANALIIGGSRGLGELTAKMLAAGGARVTVTYAAAQRDAELVAQEIRAAGFQCEAAAYDVRKSAAGQLGRLNLPVLNQLYYFATPPIFARKAPLFDPRRFAEFNAFYVMGFFDLIEACIRLNPRGFTVFCPSSTAIQSRPLDMTEYAMSKAAVEILCDDIPHYFPSIELLTARLPRLPTDQTTSVLQVESADPVGTLLPLIRKMQR